MSLYKKFFSRFYLWVDPLWNFPIDGVVFETNFMTRET